MADDISAEKRAELEKAFQNFQPKPTGGSGTQNLTTSSNDFCRNWPNVKNVLQFLATLPFIPQSVKDAINLVIQAGDTASGIICRT